METESIELKDICEKLGNYSELLQFRAKEQADRHAYTFLENGTTETLVHTYGSLDKEVRKVGGYLQAQGAANERVLLVMRSDLDYSIAFLGCLYAGSIAVTTIVPSTLEQVRRLGIIANNAQAKYVMVHRKDYDKLVEGFRENEVLRHLKWIIYDEIPLLAAESWTPAESTWDSVAFLQYTSGSTSEPKGVQVSHRNLALIGAYHEELFSLNKYDVGVTWLPQSHDMGLIFGILQPLYTGFPTCVMTPSAFLKRPLKWLQTISNYRVSFSIVPNFAYDLCAETMRPEDLESLDLSCFTLAINAAEPIKAKTLRNFAKTFAVTGFQSSALVGGYGMAETTLGVSGSKRGSSYKLRKLSVDMLEQGIAKDVDLKSINYREAVSSGSIGSYADVVIADSQTLETKAVDHIGEILIAGDIVANGYWNNDEETDYAFNVFTSDGKGPFLRTGDLGFIDREGNLFITGRAKDLIIIHGKNYAPQDIELTVEEFSPKIRTRQVSVFSVEVNNRETVVIIAEIKRGYAKETNPVELGEAVLKYVAKEYQIPVFEVVFVKRGECPKTTSGKIQRQRSKQMFFKDEFTVVGKYRHLMYRNAQPNKID